MALLRRSRKSWQIRLVILAVLFVALLALLARSVYQVFSARQAGAPAQSPRTIPNTDVSPFGANFFLAREVEAWKLDKTLQMAAEGGIRWAKVHFPWEELEPRRKGEFYDAAGRGESWIKFDQIVAACEKQGLRVVARIDRPPDWTRADNSYKERPPDNFEDYGDLIYQFVKHYLGRVDYIQVWNEPNIFPEWGNQAVNPAQYVELLKIAYRRAKEANPNVYVLCAPLAITLGQAHPQPGQWIAMNDLAFLEEMYRAGAGAYFDIYSANAFGMDRPPEDPPDANTLNFQRVLLHRRIMERYGDESKAVWFNEYGWNAAPESFPLERLIWRRVTEQQQAEWTVRGIALARREWPWAGVFMLWYFRQVGNIPVDRADYYFRMVDTDFTPRPIYQAIQEAARKQPKAGPGVYQETNPNLRMSGRWRNAIDPTASGHAFISSDVPGDELRFTFAGSSINLITRRSRDSGQFIVSLDGRAVPGLQTDAQGLSMVDLYHPTTQMQARVPLAHGLGPGDHTLRLVVSAKPRADAQGKACVLDAIEVLAEANAPLPVMPFALSLAGLVLDIWLLWRTWRRVRWIVRAPQT